jgi:hypothetical protein
MRLVKIKTCLSLSVFACSCKDIKSRENGAIVRKKSNVKKEGNSSSMLSNVQCSDKKEIDLSSLGFWST